MEPTHEQTAELYGTRVLAQGGGGAGSLHVELLQRANGSVAVTFALDGEVGGARAWEAGDVEHGVRTFLSLVRRRTTN